MNFMEHRSVCKLKKKKEKDNKEKKKAKFHREKEPATWKPGGVCLC